MRRIAGVVALAWLVMTAACGGGIHGVDGGTDGGGIDAGCKGDLAGSELQICGVPDASFDTKTCQCQGDP
jgi:hypothetical protein